MTDSAQKVYKTICEVLVARKLISAEQAKEVNMRQLKTGDSEEAIIKQLRLVDDRGFVEAKAEYLKVPFIGLVFSLMIHRHKQIQIGHLLWVKREIINQHRQPCLLLGESQLVH